MAQGEDRPVLAFLTSHWLSMVGAGLVTIAGWTWLLALPAQIRGHATNPYIGILLFVALPILFVLGLILIPIGSWLSRRNLRTRMDETMSRKESLKRLAIFLGVMTFVNIIIVSQLTYRAVEHMEGTQFCGQSCHVMKPEFTAHQASSHSRVLCVECHVAPGVSGWLEGKMAGTRQLMETTFNMFPRPIKPAMETNKLVPASETCEQCHWPDRFGPAMVRVVPEYADDEANTLTQTVLMMMIGGSGYGGIHGAHFGAGVSMRYAPTDSTRQTIPWVEYRNAKTGVVRQYTASGTKPEDLTKLQRYDMQCVDCHNRPTHTFELPERAMNRAMALGKIPADLPFVKKAGVEVLKAAYVSSEEAAQKLPAALRSFYQGGHPAVLEKRGADVDRASAEILAIYNRNVFPDLKVTWGTYVNNLGHTDFPGCFRCHDEDHTSNDQKTITQDCTTCHQLLAASEASPEILQTLGLKERLAELEKKKQRK